jgi:DNA-binding transcriptional LysR family regulator
MTQPAASLQIKALEEGLALRLFDRIWSAPAQTGFS